MAVLRVQSGVGDIQGSVPVQFQSEYRHFSFSTLKLVTVNFIGTCFWIYVFCNYHKDK